MLGAVAVGGFAGWLWLSAVTSLRKPFKGWVYTADVEVGSHS